MQETDALELVNGRYQLVRLLGEGGTGKVYLAADLARDGTPVALKRLQPDLLGAHALSSLKAEFGAMSRLEHPNVVAVHDLDVDAATGAPFLTQEYVAGTDLASLLADGTVRQVAATADLLLQVCRGLEYIHRRGLLHNDLKAQNVLVRAGAPAVCKLTDFGLASRAGGPARPLQGTLHYLAPELLRGNGVTRASDVYALGVLFYLTFAGRHPFEGSPNEVLRRAQQEEPAPPGSVAPDIPPALDGLILRMLAKEPAARPSSAADVIRELAGALGTSFDLETADTLASYARSGPFIGRRRELGRLVLAIEATHAPQADSQAPRLVLVSGESGIGKSRLVRQLRYEARVRGGAFGLGQCYEGAASAYHPFARILSQVCPEAMRPRPSGGEGDGGDALAPLRREAAVNATASAGAAGASEAEQARRRLHDAAVEVLLDAAAARPLMICLEDLHWADTASLDLLEHLARNAGSCPGLAIVATYRSEEADSGALGAALPRLLKAAAWEKLELQRLAADDVAAMLSGIFGVEAAPEPLVTLLARETEGNPLFVQVAVEALLEEQARGRSPSEWLASASDVEAIAFPASVAEALERRMSRLQDPELRVLEALAVAERPVEEGLLREVLEPDGQTGALPAALDVLLRRRLAGREISTAGSIRLRVDHVRIRDHVYEAMDWGRRRELHGRLGLALEARAGIDPSAVGLEELAHHFVNSPDARRALEYAERAGVRLRHLSVNERAMGFLERALELVPPDEAPRRLRLQLELGDACRQARERPRAMEAYERLVKAARNAGDKEMAWTGTTRLLDEQWRSGATEEAQRGAERLVTALKAEGEKFNRATCHLILANIAASRGRMDQARALTQEALELRRELGDDRGTAACLNNLGLIDLVTGCSPQGRDLLEESLALWRRAGDLQGAWEVLGNLGSWLRKRGQLAEAAARTEEAADLARRHRDRFQRGQCQVNLAAIYHAQGRLDRALVAARDAIACAAALGIDAMHCEALDRLGRLERDLGRLEEAVSIHERAAAIARRAGLASQEGYALCSVLLDKLSLPEGKRPEPRSLRDLLRKTGKLAEASGSARLRALHEEADARAALASGDAAAALEHARAAVKAAESDGLPETRAAAGLLVAECLRPAGSAAGAEAASRLADASEAARSAAALAEEAGLIETAWRARSLLAALEEAAGRKVAARDEIERAASALRGAADAIEQEAVRLTYQGEPRRAELLRRAAAQLPRRLRTPASDGTEWRSAETALSAIHEISQIVSSMTDLDLMLERVLDVALGLVGAERGLVILMDEASGEQEVRAARDLEEETVADALAYSRSVVKEAAAGRAVLALNAVADDRFRNFKSVSLYAIKSLICVPMKVRNKVIGTVYVDSRRQGTPFDERDVRFLEAFSSLAAGAVEQARLHERLAGENVYLRREADERNRYQNIIGRNVKMQAVYDLMEKVASSTLPVLIVGESGTGKELVARALHYCGPRRKGRFISENVAAIPDTLLESEMFGHVRGAFTGADRDKQGLFELADGGTLFLDEIGDMPPSMQSKLLRAIQEGEVRPVGGKDSRRVDVRIISATNKDVERLMREGRFREDLYYRLNVVRINLPALRERKEDIPLLVDHFLKKATRDSGRTPKRMEVGVLQLLLRYSWPGNVRELENEVARLAVMSPGEVITSRDVMESGELYEKITHLEEKDTFTSLEEMERRQIEKALVEALGNRGRAAELLGISRATIFRKLRKFGISH